MNEVQGRSGELIDRLIMLLNNDALGEDEWFNVTRFVEFFIGGRALGEVVPDTGPPVPGSIGEMRRQQHVVVSREKYFELLGERLRQLVAYGVEEAFFVRSIRDAVRRQLESFADVETANRSRANSRANIERMMHDTAAIAEFRAEVAKTHPAAEALSDEQIVERLRAMAERLRETSPEEALTKWAALTQWDRQAGVILPDAIFDQWLSRNMRPLS